MRLIMDKIGVIHGRFQGLHLGHMEYLLAGKERCKHLIIGITNYEPYLNFKVDNPANLNRTKAEANPFFFFVRYEMLQGSMIEAGIDISSFDIVPFPIENPDNIFNFTPREAVYYITIYDQWGYEKEKLLKKIGCRVEIMWIRNDSQRITSGTEIRNKIKSQLEWKRLVPKYVYNYIIEYGIDKRLRGGC
jgi:nicotinamide-nucleotide adenylyltransferase/phosphinothricin biosynthesis protein PhpF